MEIVFASNYWNQFSGRYQLKAIENIVYLWYEFAVVESVQLVTLVACPESIYLIYWRNVL
jgi:hypothetical protein